VRGRHLPARSWSVGGSVYTDLLRSAPELQDNAGYPVVMELAHRDPSPAIEVATRGRTRAAYARDLTDWLAFCARHGVEPLAAHRAHVDAYARELAEVQRRGPVHGGPSTLSPNRLLRLRPRRGPDRPLAAGRRAAAQGGRRQPDHRARA
jgi:hypothetical protein